MKYQPNIGAVDQVLRIGISALLIYVSLIDTSFIEDNLSSGILAFIGIGNLIVALARYCPFYALVGINTCKVD